MPIELAWTLSSGLRHRALSRRATMDSTIRAHQIMRGVDQREMRKGLRKVTQLSSGGGIVFFSQKAHIIAQGEKPFEQFACFVHAALQDIVVGKPEAACQEHALARR